MNILVTCPCGKKMQTSETARGKRIKCPACGEVLPVHGEPDSKKARPAPPPAKPARAIGPVDDEEDYENNRLRKKKKKSKARWALPEIELFGLTPVKLLIVLVVLGVIGWGIYLLVPSAHPKIVEIRRVDLYAALDVGEQVLNKTPETLKVLNRAIRRREERERGETVRDEAPDALHLGSEELLIARDNPEGDSLLLRVALSPKFLTQRAKILTGILTVQSDEIVLRGENGDVHGLLINLERKLPENVQVSIYGATQDSQFIPRDRAPWTHPGQYFLDDLKKESLPPDEKGHVALNYTGIARFEGRSGMKVDYAYDGVSVLVVWDRNSKASLTARYLEFPAGEYTFASLELTCVFPRPPGRYATPIIMGEGMSKIRLP